MFDSSKNRDRDSVDPIKNPRCKGDHRAGNANSVRDDCPRPCVVQCDEASRIDISQNPPLGRPASLKLGQLTSLFAERGSAVQETGCDLVRPFVAKPSNDRANEDADLQRLLQAL